jgi:hypothetical protein
MVPSRDRTVSVDTSEDRDEVERLMTGDALLGSYLQAEGLR